MLNLENHNPNYLSNDWGACASCNSDVDMAGIAMLGAMELGRSVYSYQRAIARIRAKIRKLKAKRGRVRLKARKRLITSRIKKLKAKRSKLKAYMKIRKQKKQDKQNAKDGVYEDDFAIAEDEDLLLSEAYADEPFLDPSENQQVISEVEQGMTAMNWGMIGLGGLLLGTLVVVLAKGKPRRERLNIGKKRSNPKRKKSKKRSMRKKK
mgnify:CR=1 FL=1